MQDKKPASYRKPVRIPTPLWEQIKDKKNVSRFILDAIAEKLERDKD